MMSNALEPLKSREVVEVPAPVAKILKLMGELCAQSKPFNTNELRDELIKTLSWKTQSGNSPEEKLAQQRTLHWVLQEFDATTPESPLYRLQIALVTLSVLSLSAKEVTEAVPQEMARPILMDRLLMLLKGLEISIKSNFLSIMDELWYEETLAIARSGDFGSLVYRIRHLNILPLPEVQQAVMLLMRFAPDRLARHIEERRDVFFAIIVRDTLLDDALKFALSVNDVTFKFICVVRVADVADQDATDDAVDITRDLLFQVAKSDLWRNWLLGFTRYPQINTVSSTALAKALIQLPSDRWPDFVDAVELWTHAGTALSVASILVPFLHALGKEKSGDMWQRAFKRWDKWDYGCNDKDKHMFAPAECSFDFPVAMYYASIPLEDAQAEEAKLKEQISTAEQKWFSDLSALVTYRNRLISRLRLVQHGFAIRNASQEGVNPLPSSIRPESEYAAIRYGYYDASAPAERTRF